MYEKKKFIVQLNLIFLNIFKAALNLSGFEVFLFNGTSVVVTKLKPEIKLNLLLLS